MCPYTFSLNKPCVLLLIVFSMGFSCFGQSTFNIKWGTHHAFDGNLTGSNYATTDTGFSAAYSSAFLKSLNADGSLGSDLVDDVDLIQLGFFDTDPTDDSTSATISPNTSTSDLFKGVWTPLSTKTVIAQDWNTGTLEDGVGGEFYFYSSFSDDSLGGEESEAAADWKVVHNNLNSNTLSFDDVLDYASGTPANNNVVDDRVNALITASASNPVMLGIRFYDAGGDPSSGSDSTRYNTIMSTDWTLDWSTGAANLDLLEWTGSAVQVQDSLVFEFDNSAANTANISKVGTSDTRITSNDFVTTITYFDGDETIDVGNGGIGSSVFSGFDGTGKLYGGQDANIVTLHSQSGNTGTDAYEFDGDFYRAATGTDSTDLTIIKTGAGDQILSGNLNLADSDNTSASGGLNIASGNLILKPASGKTQVVEYLTGAGGLMLDNSGINDGTIVTLGFANQTSSTFSGTVVLDGNGVAGEAKIKVSKSRDDTGFVASDFADTQTLSGVISNANGNKKLVKDGTGQLVLSGNNTFTGGVEIEDGTLVAGHANALGASNTVTITKGKLEVENGITLAPTTLTAGDSEKTMIGGRGTLNDAVTIGSGNGEVDVISVGDGISSSLSNSSTQQQVSLGDRANAIGTFTVSDTLTLATGGVYDWEVSDFTGSAGSDWDLLKFDTLTISATSANPFVINVMGLASDGTAGAMAGGNVWGSYQTTSGFKFMEATGNGSGYSGSAGVVDKFSVVSNNWAHYNDQHLHNWDVWYDGSGAFYLQYSAVPEPSTYMMITGLLMVPGMSYVRRLKRKKDSEITESSL